MSTGKEMSTEVSVADRISEKIRSEFVSLVSDEEWNALVSREVRRFTMPPDRRYHGDPEPLSPLGSMVQEALKQIAREKIAAEIDALGNLQGPDGEEIIRRLVKDCAAELLGNAMAPIVQNAIWNLRQQLQQNMTSL